MLISHSTWPRVGVLGCGFAAILALLEASHDPRDAAFVWNVTSSAPIGLYRVHMAKTLHRGDVVLVMPPEWVQRLAAARRYLPEHIPLVKRIAALAGQKLCAKNGIILIDDKPVAARLRVDSSGRALPAWQGCHTLHSNEVFLLMKDVRTSFDGRYFGPVPVSSVLGKLQPLWTR